MANVQVSVFIPEELVTAADEVARFENRSRNYVLSGWLRDGAKKSGVEEVEGQAEDLEKNRSVPAREKNPKRVGRVGESVEYAAFGRVLPVGDIEAVREAARRSSGVPDPGFEGVPGSRSLACAPCKLSILSVWNVVLTSPPKENNDCRRSDLSHSRLPPFDDSGEKTVGPTRPFNSILGRCVLVAIHSMAELTERIIMTVNNFDVLKAMAEQSMDIRLCNTIVRMDYNAKVGTKVVVGVPGNVCFEISEGKLNALLLLFDIQQFNELKKAMEKDGLPQP